MVVLALFAMNEHVIAATVSLAILALFAVNMSLLRHCIWQSWLYLLCHWQYWLYLLLICHCFDTVFGNLGSICCEYVIVETLYLAILALFAVSLAILALFAVNLSLF